MSDDVQYGIEAARRIEASFRRAVEEARASHTSPEELGEALTRLGFTPAGDGRWVAPNGAEIALPAEGPVGMAPLVKALRAAAGLPDEAA